MEQRKHWRVRTAAAAAAAATLALLAGSARAEVPAAPAAAAGASSAEMATEIKAMRERLEQLERKQAEAAVRERDAATARDVAVDADRHSPLYGAVDSSFLGGWENGGFKIRSADGNFLLHPWFQMQFRDVTNFRDGAKSGDRDDLQNGFELRRMKFGFDGNAFSPNLTYLFLWATNRKDGTPQLEDAWVKWKFSDSLAVKAGQLKNPLDHEQVVSSKYQLAVERSLIAGVFVNGDDYVQGVSLIYDNNGAVRAEAAFTDGIRSQNENFQDFPSQLSSGNNPKADFGVAGRVEYKATGDWKAYDYISALGTKRDTLVFGAGADYTESGDTGVLTHVVDAQYTTAGGLGVYGAYLGRYTARNSAAGGDDTYDCTFRLFGSYLIRQKWEPFVQYQYIHFDDKALSAGTDNYVHVLTGGVNYYLHGQNAKFTLDLSYLPNGSPVGDDSSGTLANDGRTEVIIRAQFQLLL